MHFTLLRSVVDGGLLSGSRGDPGVCGCSEELANQLFVCRCLDSERTAVQVPIFWNWEELAGFRRMLLGVRRRSKS